MANKYQELVGLFLKKDIKINWSQSIKIAKQLLTKYPEIEFWRSLDVYYYKLNNLAFFLMEDKKNELERLYVQFKSNFIPPMETFKLEGEAVIKIKEVQQKPMN